MVGMFFDQTSKKHIFVWWCRSIQGFFTRWMHEKKDTTKKSQRGYISPVGRKLLIFTKFT